MKELIAKIFTIRAAVIGLTIIHVALLVRLSFLYSPTIDEVAYLPAGISHLEQGHYELARINPPLARIVAAIPLQYIDKKTDWSSVNYNKLTRSEHQVGKDFVTANGKETFRIFSIARLTNIFFSLIAAYFIFTWSKELYGKKAALAALTLWFFCPNILGHGALASPDIASLAMGVASLYSFRRWINTPTLLNLTSAGLWLGLAQLSRTTWLILYPLMILLSLVHLCKSPNRTLFVKLSAHLTLLFTISVATLNFGYGFQETFTPLGEFQLRSKTFSCSDSANSLCLKNILPNSFPIPLPADYLYGIDTQKLSFEHPYISYFAGEFKRGGSWDYYLKGLLLKLPVGTLLLFFLSIAALFSARYRATSWFEETIFITSILTIVIFVSSQTGFNQHVRYIFPILPFLFISLSRLFKPFETTSKKARAALLSLLLIAPAESLWRYPDSISFFNIAAGGPADGRFLLNYSNLDWGQDLLNLAKWQERNPEKKLKLVYFGNLTPSIAGFDGEFTNPYFTRLFYSNAPLTIQELTPGYYALSIQFLQQLHGQLLGNHPISRYDPAINFYGWLLPEEPFARAGYSIYIYHLTEEKISDLRKKTEGLPLR